MKIIPSQYGGVYAFTVYPETQMAESLVRGVVTYLTDRSLLFTFGSHPDDPDRLLHVPGLTLSQAEEFRQDWDAYIHEGKPEPQTS